MFNGEDQRASKQSKVQRMGTPVNEMKESDMPAPIMNMGEGGQKKKEGEKKKQRKAISGIESVTLPR